MKRSKRQDCTTEEKNIDASVQEPPQLRLRNLADMPMSLPTINHALLHEYLNMDSPDEIARLAASMAPLRTEFLVAKDVVDAAVSIRREATAHVASLRRNILRRMSPETLLKLTSELKLEDLANGIGDDNWRLIYDPLIGPVLERLLEHPPEAPGTINASSAPEVIENALYEAIEQANKRTTLRLPFPTTCTMEEALRYAANEPAADWGMLEQAFRAFWVVSPHGWMSGEDAKTTFKYQGVLIRDALYLAELPKNSELRLPYLDHNEMLIADLTNLFENNRFRERWQPGAPLPTNFVEELEVIYPLFWPEPGRLGDLSLLKILSYDFHGFWQKHRGTYGQIYSAEAEAKKIAARAERNRAAAPQKTIVRDRKLWVQRTEDFIASESFRNLAGSLGERPSLEAFKHAAESHLRNCSDEVEKRSKVGHPTTKQKVQGFLGLLPSFSHSKAKTDIDAFCKQIKHQFKIAVMDSITVSECSDLLEKALASRRDALPGQAAKQNPPTSRRI
jgi:hypothetical protein